MTFSTSHKMTLHSMEDKSVDIYDIDLQINEEALNFGPVPGRTSDNCTLKQCRTQNNRSECWTCRNVCG